MKLTTAIFETLTESLTWIKTKQKDILLAIWLFFPFILGFTYEIVYYAYFAPPESLQGITVAILSGILLFVWIPFWVRIYDKMNWG